MFMIETNLGLVIIRLRSRLYKRISASLRALISAICDLNIFTIDTLFLGITDNNGVNMLSIYVLVHDEYIIVVFTVNKITFRLIRRK